jgi:hypothetical protein
LSIRPPERSLILSKHPRNDISRILEGALNDFRHSHSHVKKIDDFSLLSPILRVKLAMAGWTVRLARANILNKIFFLTSHIRKDIINKYSVQIGIDKPFTGAEATENARETFFHVTTRAVLRKKYVHARKATPKRRLYAYLCRSSDFLSDAGSLRSLGKHSRLE